VLLSLNARCRRCLPALQVHTEEEIRRILPLASKHQVPVTFRAAGTSLSGQVRGGWMGRLSQPEQPV
jgi:FAD/FMN-containing dehydrogenase